MPAFTSDSQPRKVSFSKLKKGEKTVVRRKLTIECITIVVQTYLIVFKNDHLAFINAFFPFFFCIKPLIKALKPHSVALCCHLLDAVRAQIECCLYTPLP